jgi:hypothetical protein
MEICVPAGACCAIARTGSTMAAHPQLRTKRLTI